MFYKHPIVKKAIISLNTYIPNNCIGIHGKIYNIDNFDHPGDNTFIEINKGCDVTTLFETHHINYKLANDTLDKLTIVGTYNSKINYNFNSYYILREKIFSKFKNKKSRVMNNISKYALFGYITLGTYLHYKLLQYNFSNIETSFTNFIALCLLSSLVNGILGGFGHNGIHKLLYSSLLLDWNGLSSLEWLLEHVHSHHMYTNTIYDHDSISMKPFLNWIPSNTNSIFSVNGKHFIFLIAELVVPIQGNFIHKFRWSILFNNKYQLWLRLAPFVFILRIFSHILHQGILFGLINIIICLIFSGYYFSYLAHLNHVNFDNKNHDSLDNLDFINHQINNTNDIKINKNLSSVFLNLNKQKMHHLFPTIDHSQLNKLYKICNKDINCENKNIKLLNNELNHMLKLFSNKKFIT
uniref:Fatty acid desaturase domain-containing protein n=1 Tax=viral metagenome TaxID=1070528 RepID=A0A6C0LCX6_9ZZZZ